MKLRVLVVYSVLVALCATAVAQQEQPFIHDPVMAYEDSTYYIYSTGMGIQQMTSRDGKSR